MKMYCSCHQCMKESVGDVFLFGEGIGNLAEEGYVVFTCEKGHTTYFNNQSFKFETLFNKALKFYVDGEYEASLLMFSNSLERFYEFFIKSMCRNDGLDNLLIDYSLFNREGMNRSENQLGAFALLHLLKFNEYPVVLNNKQRQLRNDVVHNGKIIDKVDCYKYGNAVFDIIKEVVCKMKKYNKNIFIEESLAQQIKVGSILKQREINNVGSMLEYNSFTMIENIESLNYDSMIETTSKMEKTQSLEKIKERNIMVDMLRKRLEKILEKVKFKINTYAEKYAKENFELKVEKYENVDEIENIIINAISDKFHLVCSAEISKDDNFKIKDIKEC